jgi:hypothetical protein
MLACYRIWPLDSHWSTIDHLVGYVKKNPHKAINFWPGKEEVQVYVDAGWGGKHEHSNSGFILCHCRNQRGRMW